MKEINKKILKPISLTPETMEYIERSDYLLRNYKAPESIKKFNQLVFHSYINADTNDDGLPDAWFTWNPKDSEITSEITSEGTLRIKNPTRVRGGIATRKFDLKPETKYILEISVKKQLGTDEKFIIYLLSDKGKHIQLEIPRVKLGKDGQIYTFEFTTTSDIVGGKQYVRFDYAGSNDKYIEISQVNVYRKE
jgi:hypothetical protein